MFPFFILLIRNVVLAILLFLPLYVIILIQTFLFIVLKRYSYSKFTFFLNMPSQNVDIFKKSNLRSLFSTRLFFVDKRLTIYSIIFNYCVYDTFKKEFLFIPMK